MKVTRYDNIAKTEVGAWENETKWDCFHQGELGQRRGHENKVRNKENFQSRNFKEDVSESFLIARKK